MSKHKPSEIEVIDYDDTLPVLPPRPEETPPTAENPDAVQIFTPLGGEAQAEEQVGETAPVSIPVDETQPAPALQKTAELEAQLAEQPEPVLEVEPEPQPELETQPVAIFQSGPDAEETVQSEPQAVPQPEPQAQPAAQPAPEVQPRHEVHLTRGELFGLLVGSSLITLVLSVFLSLGFLALINGGLGYARQAEFDSLSRQMEGLQSQADGLQQDLSGLRARLDTLEALSGRMGVIERTTQELRGTVDAAAEQLSGVQDQIGGMLDQLGDLESRSQVFGRFLDGLRNLLNGTEQP